MTGLPVIFQAGTSDVQLYSPGSRLPGLSTSEERLLRKKQTQLRSALYDRHLDALAVTLIFAREEAGTAVCIRDGWVLTCAHCIGDNEEEYQQNKRQWLLFYTGLAVQVECCAWDAKRDLALLKIIALETAETGRPTFPVISLASAATRTAIMCIGQPGRDDLESSKKKKTPYHLIEISEGHLRGIVGDPQDNSEIGALKHDAWTYWGHSGAPLIKRDGTLAGLHSSWDDQTGKRHGIPLVALRQFVAEHAAAMRIVIVID